MGTEKQRSGRVRGERSLLCSGGVSRNRQSATNHFEALHVYILRAVNGLTWYVLSF
jgi:hypothetical protein